MNITKNRRLWFTISGVAVAASLLLSLLLGFRLGLDFTGGVRWHVEMNEPTEKSVTENYLGEQATLTKAASVQETDNNGFLITLQDLPDNEIQKIKDGFAASVGEFEEISYRKVDSSIGQSFQRKSAMAVLVALIGIVIFVWLAFQKVPKSVNPWRFGFVAIAALFHDIIILLGVFAVLSKVMNFELDLQFITALLATLGFSVNDTIVILDRVRENIGKQKSGENFEDTVEKSIRQTLVRSINTSISTLLPLLALLIWGSSSLFTFVLALIIGILVGTYSSIFLAAPLLAEWKIRGDK